MKNSYFKIYNNCIKASITVKVIVFEPNMNSIPHSEINSGVLSLIELVYPNYDLHFIADLNHFKNLTEIRNLNKWNFKHSKVFSYVPKYFILNDIILVWKLFMIVSRSKKDDKIILLGIMPFSHIFISFLNSFFKRFVLICLHGQMESFLKDSKIGFSRYYYQISMPFFKRNDNIYYCIFGESIKNNIQQLFSINKKLIVIDQPYLYNNINEIKSISQRQSVTLGFLGRFDHSKNVKEFFIFIDMLKQEILNRKINVIIIGKIFCEIESKYLDLISFSNKFVSNEEFRYNVSKLDFVISFTDIKYYRATPSGVFFDCIKWEIPILSLNNNFVSYYFNRYCKIGEIFESTSEMVSFIKKYVSERESAKEKYILYKNNLKKMKSKLSIENIKDTFISQL